MTLWTPRIGGPSPTLGDLDEARILAALNSELAMAHADVGPGDDAAVLPPMLGRTVVTTDSMVLDLDWRDDWSGPVDVGRKVVAQNLADVIAMGAHPVGVVVALAAEKATRVDWVQDLTRGMAQELRRAGVGTLGGDLSGLPHGVVITVTALGELLPEHVPMLRSAAQVDDLIVVSDPLGRSQAGLTWLMNAAPGEQPSGRAVERCVAFHRAPEPRYAAAHEALAAGLRCALDVSDGLVRDAGRIAQASSVCLDLDETALRRMGEELGLPDVVAEHALECVLVSGEEHALLGTCSPGQVPTGWHIIGTVRAGEGVLLDGAPVPVVGWDHFES